MRWEVQCTFAEFAAPEWFAVTGCDQLEGGPREYGNSFAIKMPEASMIRFRFREPCTSGMLQGPWKETGAVTQFMFIEPLAYVIQVPTGEMTARPNSILVVIGVPVERTLEGL